MSLKIYLEHYQGVSFFILNAKLEKKPSKGRFRHQQLSFLAPSFQCVIVEVQFLHQEYSFLRRIGIQLFWMI